VEPFGDTWLAPQLTQGPKVPPVIKYSTQRFDAFFLGSQVFLQGLLESDTVLCLKLPCRVNGGYRIGLISMPLQHTLEGVRPHGKQQVTAAR
jgi:hypothetical protein